jgi:hypothetical protein
VPKKFALHAAELEKLATGHGWCIASDKIMVDGRKVGWMYREESSDELDSGWRFFAGDESDEYANDPKNFSLYDVNTVSNYDPAIVQFLDAPVGSAYFREGSGNLKAANH